MKNKIFTLIIIILSFCILMCMIWFGSSTLINYRIENVSSTHNEIHQNEGILNLSQAALYINVSEEKLKWLVQNSKYKDGAGIPYFMFDEKILFSKEALSKWIIHIAENNFKY